jgi:hypothetical protein
MPTGNISIGGWREKTLVKIGKMGENAKNSLKHHNALSPIFRFIF